MYTGQMMIYAGIGLIAGSAVLFLILSVVFSVRKKKLIEKIYNGGI